jgi:hypothetical protein
LCDPILQALDFARHAVPDQVQPIAVDLMVTCVRLRRPITFLMPRGEKENHHGAPTIFFAAGSTLLQA